MITPREQQEMEQHTLAGRRVVELIVLGALMVAGVGLFVEIGHSRDAAPSATSVPSQDTARNAVPDSHATIQPAVSYDTMPTTPRGPNANWNNHIAKLAIPPVDLYESLAVDDAARAKALADRARTRAYPGAPPVVPHPIDQRDAASCVVCHAQGKRITATLIAPAMSHPYYANCTQCHAPSTNPTLTASSATPNSFVARREGGKGARPWPGAPPTIPHTTWMRQSCTACHGTLGDFGLRSTHPWRQNCVQCHASSATLDQRRFGSQSPSGANHAASTLAPETAR